ncbi:MAG: hypothetical protein VX834_13550, partial [Myxococcota bacterium]|nr:hypothetical protein [Myxococcota bacterium]
TFFSFALRNPAPPVWCWLLVGAALGTPLASARKSQTTLLSIAWFVFGISTMTWALWTGHTSHLTRRGVHAMAQRDIETTTTSLEAAAQHPNADRALLKLCYAYGKANQRQLAARTCLRALERQPFNPIIHDQLARQYHAAGNLNQALIHYERTLDLQPKFERARIERDKVRQFLDQTRDTKNR